MTDTSLKINSLSVPKGSLGIIFMGQAGIVIKTSSGKYIGIDLYLSDCCERYFGFKRMFPKLISPFDIEFDYIITTHAHYDHFDVDSIPFLTAPAKTRLICAEDCQVEIERLHIDTEKVTYIKLHDKYCCDDFKLEAVECDHGELAPKAVGLLIESDGKTVYIAGDTCFHEEYAKAISKNRIDIAFVPINGAFGNLNEKEGALYASIIKPKLVVPCHFWNFAAHGGNPQLFIDEMKDKYPDQGFSLMSPGETKII